MPYSILGTIPGLRPPPAEIHTCWRGAEFRPGTKVLLLGEAFGEQEDLVNLPFVGASGQELTKIITEAGFSRSDCSLTNVFNFQPFANDLNHFCLNPVDWAAAVSSFPVPAGLSPLTPCGRDHRFAPAIALPALARLRDEIISLNPNLIVALGNVALWALTRQTGISKYRGTILESTLVPGKKVLPTYHPASIYKGQWENRAIIVMDLIKAKRELAFPETRKIRRELWLKPTVEDFRYFRKTFLDTASVVAVDIETKRQQITCIGFSPSPERAIVVPLWSSSAPNWSYYSEADELAIMREIRSFNESPVIKVFQNGPYDLQYLYRYGQRVRNYSEDTMLLHYSLYSEMEKGLDFLGSIYTNEIAWKQLRPRGSDQIKRED